MADTVSLLRRLILESPPGEWAVNQLRELLIGALKQGPIPQHVAFEMDGNRRYARSRRMETVEGHHRGFEALARIMEICYKCGVKVVTVYAFSIENFNRPKYEVEGLMQLAKVKLEQLTTYGDILDRYGACVRILGQRELIREDVLEVMDKAVARTKHNKKAVLNICFPYTSRAEMTTAIRSTVQEFLSPTPPKNTPFSPSRIRQKILSNQLDGREPLPTIPDEPLDDVEFDDNDSSSTTLPPDSPEPRLLTRSGSTSGVERLSDFMLWQCHQDTHIFFRKCLWPDFDLKDFIWVLLEWQWRQKQSDRENSSVKARTNKARSMME
ncbi:hypothetical protein TrVFT333_009908 [Trichoderma virens FT-333]|nr:hypothetical protein TrVFT333_009908 [Trichoderma virens FT-333]